MTHQHLRFNLFHSLEDNTDNDEQRRTADRNVDFEYRTKNQREYRNQADKQRARHSDAAQYFINILRGGFSRTDTRHKTAVALHVVRHLNRVELNLGIEEGEEQNQQEVKDDISR